MTRAWCLVFVFLLAACGAEQATESEQVSEPVAAAESYDFLDTNGNGYRYEDLQGQWLVVNYWATWCAPCIKEIPELIHLGEKHDDIMVFGVNFDAPPPDEMAKQIARMKITFPVYAEDPMMDLGIDMPQVLPTTVIVNPEGNVQSVLVGPQTEASLLAEIRGELEPSAGSEPSAGAEKEPSAGSEPSAVSEKEPSASS